MSAATGLEILRWADLDDSARQCLLGSAAYSAATAHPLFSALSQRVFRAYFGAACTDLTQVAVRDGNPVGYLPASSFDAEASYFGLPARAFGETGAALMQSLAEAASRAGCRSLKLDQREVGAFSGNARLGPVQTTATAVVDLARDAAAIKAALRKSYKSLVNWGLNNLELRVLDAQRANRDAFLAFRDFHRAVSGRSTRSDETWEIQFEMIRHGEAYAVLGSRDSRLVSANLVQHSASEAYYGVGVYDREMMAQRVPLAHGPLFHSILHAREIGLRKFVLGDVGASPDEKLGNIARFKRGFATAIEPGGWAHLRLG